MPEFTKIKFLYSEKRKATYLCQCSKGHFRKLRSDYVSTAKCGLCFMDRCRDEAALVGIGLLSYADHAKGRYMLKCGCEKTIRFSEVRRGMHTKCRIHEGKTYTFLYCIKLQHKKREWIKLGVTSGKLRQRFYDFNIDGEVVKTCVAFHIYPNKDLAFKKETELKNKYKNYNLDPSNLKLLMKTGYTECYSMEIEEQIKNEIIAIQY